MKNVILLCVSVVNLWGCSQAEKQQEVNPILTTENYIPTMLK